MTIRDAVASDLPRVLEMAKAFAQTVALGQKAGIHEGRIELWVSLALEQPNMRLRVADVNGAVVGMMGIAVHEHPLLDLTMAFVVSWWVDVAHRGRIGIALLKDGLAWADDMGATSVVVSVSKDDPSAGKVCERAGFTVTESAWTRRS